jgi:hypothetical protein
MSQTVLFEIGAVIFVVVSTAVFLYGLTIFRDWQDRDETQTRVRVPADEALLTTDATGNTWPSTAA